MGHSDVLCANRSATVRVTRLSRAWRAPHCFHALCVLRCSERQQDLRNHPTSDYKLSWLFLKCQRFRRSWSSTIESVETVCLPHATDGPKSRKLHYGEFVGRPHVSPPNPRIKARIQRAALEPFGTPFSPIFRRATKDGATGGRWLPNAAGKYVKPTPNFPFHIDDSPISG